MSAATTEVELTTSIGAITLELYGDVAPITVDNFLAYVRSVAGSDVVRRIEQARTGSPGNHRDVPLEPVTIVATKILAD